MIRIRTHAADSLMRRPDLKLREISLIAGRQRRRELTNFWCSIEQKNIQSVPYFAHSEHLLPVSSPHMTQLPLARGVGEAEGVFDIEETRFEGWKECESYTTIGNESRSEGQGKGGDQRTSEVLTIYLESCRGARANDSR